MSLLLISSSPPTSLHLTVGTSTYTSLITVGVISLNALDINVNPIPDNFVAAGLGSPAELRVYDSQGRVTGLVNGEEKSEISYSFCFGNIIVVLLPRDTYRFQVVGTSIGAYNLTAKCTSEITT